MFLSARLHILDGTLWHALYYKSTIHLSVIDLQKAFQKILTRNAMVPYNFFALADPNVLSMLVYSDCDFKCKLAID